MKNTYTASSPEDTERIGRALALSFKLRGIHRATIALRGELGVGKTAFTRGFASAFELRGVRSPTYTVVNEYRGAEAVVYHFDMYRIEDEDELYGIGFDDYLAAEAFCLIEWSENVEECLPSDRYTVTIERVGPDRPDERRITVEAEEELSL